MVLQEYALCIEGAAVDAQCIPKKESEGCLWRLKELIEQREKAQPLGLNGTAETRTYDNGPVPIEWRTVRACVSRVGMCQQGGV